MSTNKNTHDGHREGAIRDRSQFQTPSGQWAKRDRDTGRILDVKADEAVLDAAGMPDILKVLPIIFSPGNRVYYGVGDSLGHAFAVGKEI